MLVVWCYLSHHIFVDIDIGVFLMQQHRRQRILNPDERANEDKENMTVLAVWLLEHIVHCGKLLELFHSITTQLSSKKYWMLDKIKNVFSLFETHLLLSTFTQNSCTIYSRVRCVFSSSLLC